MYSVVALLANILKLIRSRKVGNGKNCKGYIYPYHFPEKDISMPNKISKVFKVKCEIRSKNYFTAICSTLC